MLFFKKTFVLNQAHVNNPVITARWRNPAYKNMQKMQKKCKLILFYTAF